MTMFLSRKCTDYLLWTFHPLPWSCLVSYLHQCFKPTMWCWLKKESSKDYVHLSYEFITHHIHVLFYILFHIWNPQQFDCCLEKLSTWLYELTRRDLKALEDHKLFWVPGLWELTTSVVWRGQEIAKIENII